MTSSVCISLSLLCILSGCTTKPVRFRQLSEDRTGLHFSNNIVVSDTFNAVLQQYAYNGSGVAAGDLNDDGLDDLVFGGNQQGSKIYLNRGGLRFEDITEVCGIKTNAWINGVSIADINGDGRKDIYLCVGDLVAGSKNGNLLYINQGVDKKGNPVFVEMAASYGLNEKGYSTQAAFLDYDRDGDEDIYILKNLLNDANKNAIRSVKTHGESASTDKLFRNNNDGSFTDVSQEAGITIEGYGLGVVVNDINFDGWPDIYVSNDFISSDFIWINNGNGTFTNQSAAYLKHTSYNGMGVDIADFNNDGLPDILQVDMLPEDNYGQKMMINNQNTGRFDMARWKGYQDQYIRNTLQLNRGFTQEGHPVFSDISFMAGVAATGWSWAALFCDMDNDGRKDIFISNGYRKNVTNLDFMSYSPGSGMFGGETKNVSSTIFRNMMSLKDIKPDNYFFRNRGDATFENVTAQWGVHDPSFSNGALYADLDNDGDMDIVTSNIDQPVSLYENLSENKRDESHFIEIELKENSSAVSVLNTKVFISCGGVRQYVDYTPVRGYLSGMGSRVHFGTGRSREADTLTVIWPDGKKEERYHIPCDSIVAIYYETAKDNLPVYGQTVNKQPTPLLQENQLTGISFLNQANDWSDFTITATMPHLFSRQGPSITVGDINNDGLDDVLVGGNKKTKPCFFIQDRSGKFISAYFQMDSIMEQTGSLLFDADNDGDNDLLVCSAGYQKPSGKKEYLKKLYRNNGKGIFLYDPGALPFLNQPSSCVSAADFDGDGDLDVFIGGQVSPEQYPIAAKSSLLQNENGKFIEVTEKYLPGISMCGIVNAALWTDYNNDGRMDLILAGEWMPVTLLENTGKGFKNTGPLMGLSRTNGFWNSINGADIDNDGDIDYVLGNIGQNTNHPFSENQPMEMYAADFDGNGWIDPFIFAYTMNREYAIHPRDMLADQVPAIKRRFARYADFAGASFSETLRSDEVKKAHHFTVYENRSVLLINNGRAPFTIRALSAECQYSPVFGTLLKDINGDGATDLVTVGNSFSTETMMCGRLDAGYGNVFLGNGTGTFSAVPFVQSGFELGGDGKSLAWLETARGVYTLSSQNNGELLVHQMPFAPAGMYRAEREDAWVLFYKNEKVIAKMELYYGSGYLSQSSRYFTPPVSCDKMEIVTFGGQKRRIVLL